MRSWEFQAGSNWRFSLVAIRSNDALASSASSKRILIGLRPVRCVSIPAESPSNRWGLSPVSEWRGTLEFVEEVFEFQVMFFTCFEELPNSHVASFAELVEDNPLEFQPFRRDSA